MRLERSLKDEVRLPLKAHGQQQNGKFQQKVSQYGNQATKWKCEREQTDRLKDSSHRASIRNASRHAKRRWRGEEADNKVLWFANKIGQSQQAQKAQHFYGVGKCLSWLLPASQPERPVEL